MLKLADRFKESQGAPLKVDGECIHMLYELPPIDSAQLLNVRLQSAGVRPQALRLKARGGSLNLEGQQLEDVVLWTDTAPEQVLVGLEPIPHGLLIVRVWNSWRDDAGTMQAWIGDAGIVVDRMEAATVLRCSDGYEPPSFADLVATLSWRTARRPMPD